MEAEGCPDWSHYLRRRHDAPNEQAAQEAWTSQIDEARKLAASERIKVHGFALDVWPELTPVTFKKG